MASVDGTPFVFHDAAGRRWSRIKRITFGATVALVVLAGAVVLGVTHVAPGRAPWFHATVPQPMPDWPARDAGGDPSSGAAVPAQPSGGVAISGGPAVTQAQPPPTATGGHLRSPLMARPLRSPRGQSLPSSRPSDRLW